MEHKFLLQGVTGDSHLDEILDIIKTPNIERLIISVAFLSQRGFGLLSDSIQPISEKTTIIAGIRNGITTAQGLLACIDCGCKTYAADTGSRSVLFHPKTYLGRSSSEARLLLGSANLTVGGLNSNIEASVKMIADMSNVDDKEFVADIEDKIDAMSSERPKHFFEITSRDHVLELFESGRLVDEERRRPPPPYGFSKNRDLDDVPLISLKKQKLNLGQVASLAEDDKTKTASEPAQPSPSYGKPLWISNPLKPSHLNIPVPSGAIRGILDFARGQMKDIDPRHYFREDVFSDLDWQYEKKIKKTHLERATGEFFIVIKGEENGPFTMQLTHDTRTDTIAYEIKHYMTQLYWSEEVKTLVDKKDLLGRSMYLYQNENNSDQFILEID